MQDGQVIAAIQEERLLRQKRAYQPGARASLSIAYCLEAGHVAPEDLDLVVLCSAGNSSNADEDLQLNPLLRPGYHGLKTAVIGHHWGHAVAAFATSGFSDAAVLVVDGSGSPWSALTDAERDATSELQRESAQADQDRFLETVSMYYAHEKSLIPIQKHFAKPDERAIVGMPWFWSVGQMYESVAWRIFGGDMQHSLDGAGKVMGLAPYGSPVIPAEQFASFVDGQIAFFDDIPRETKREGHWPNHADLYRDLAASVQRALEELLVQLARRLRIVSGCSKLCYAGGVALNGVANERIIREADFDDVYIMPAAEDSGTALGAAHFGLWRLGGQHTTGSRTVVDAMGRLYGTAEITAATAAHPRAKALRSDGIAAAVADLLEQGKIVGWFSGRSELGPRALGQRSILCDPRRQDMKDRLNRDVKFREPFRPFAPAILLQDVREWFEVDSNFRDSPFMLRVLKFREEKRSAVPAVVHVDGTGRVQTVTREANPDLYRLIQAFGRKTGTPILLNTSFNIASEPMVETPEDALWCFLSTGLDYLMLEDRLMEKAADPVSLLDLPIRLTAERISRYEPVERGASKPYDGPGANFRVLWSFHADRLSELENFASERRIAHTRIVVKTRWGPAVHLATTDVFSLLNQVDGRRTGREILASVSSQTGLKYTELDFLRLLSHLRRASVIAFDVIHLQSLVYSNT